MRHFWLMLWLLLSGPALAAPADGWITHPAAVDGSGPVVLHFRRALAVAGVPKALPVTITADNRFVLFVNGRRVASGPSTGTIAHWRTEQGTGLDSLRGSGRPVECRDRPSRRPAGGFRLEGPALSSRASP
jgi:hypothetical protein